MTIQKSGKSGGGATNTTGLGAGIGFHADLDERLSSYVLAGYIRSIMDANYPGVDGASDDYIIQSRLILAAAGDGRADPRWP